VRFDETLQGRARANLTSFERRAISVDGRKAAAVAVVLLPDEEGRGCFLLTKRAPTLRAHTGQWALPGGRMDAGESAPVAALRELREEVGLTLGGETELGLLDDYPTRSGFVITPVVFWAESPGALTPNPAEVARVHLVPLEVLDAPDVPRFISIPEKRPAGDPAAHPGQPHSCPHRRRDLSDAGGGEPRPPHPRGSSRTAGLGMEIGLAWQSSRERSRS
jgi:8-oxo-dGTP pyrophosphatase MutT (NUDIX family)